jgi:hypothetical protein
MRLITAALEEGDTGNGWDGWVRMVVACNAMDRLYGLYTWIVIK